MRPRWLQRILLVLAGLLLIGCSSPAAPGDVSPGSRLRLRTPAVATATPRVVGTVVAISPRSVVRTYTDAQGRTITLYYGRAVGRRGDWGWAHIVGKHIRGEWADGGPVTTFDVIGLTTSEAVQEVIGRSLREDAQPDPSAQGRREYRWPVPNSRYEVLTVVGGDGAIITAYPDPIARSR